MFESQSRLQSERGAVLVFTAIAIVVLVGFMTFVADNGIRWVSRAQAQNAADAGALAGAIARAFDDVGATPGVKATNSARNTAEQNLVWRQAPAVDVTWACPPGVTGSCVQVDVFRGAPDRTNVMRGTSLPLFFGPVLNISTHGVRATATARVSNGNATNRLRPFAVMDRWVDYVSPALPNPYAFNPEWDEEFVTPPFGTADFYVPPSAGSNGSGYSVPGDVGQQVILKTGNGTEGSLSDLVSGWSLPLRLPDGAGDYVSGAQAYNSAVKFGNGNLVTIGQYLPTESGQMVGPTRQGVETDNDSLIQQDPKASWNDSTKTVENSCAPGCAPFSPRIVPIAVFDFHEFWWRQTFNNWDTEWIPGVPGASGHPGAGSFSCPIGGKCVRVTNIIGFFVESMSGGDVTGRVVMYPGEFVAGAPNLGSGSSFLQVIQLVR
jgi:Flp pilus assembly protein TadG